MVAPAALRTCLRSRDKFALKKGSIFQYCKTKGTADWFD